MQKKYRQRVKLRPLPQREKRGIQQYLIHPPVPLGFSFKFLEDKTFHLR